MIVTNHRHCGSLLWAFKDNVRINDKFAPVKELESAFGAEPIDTSLMFLDFKRLCTLKYRGAFEVCEIIC
jgi:hypothetical protein